MGKKIKTENKLSKSDEDNTRHFYSLINAGNKCR